jgi:hypothetical protein
MTGEEKKKKYSTQTKTGRPHTERKKEKVRGNKSERKREKYYCANVIQGQWTRVELMNELTRLHYKQA